MNLHLAYGVCDSSKKIYKTPISYITDCMKSRNCDGNDTLYAVIINNKLYTVKIKSFDDKIIFVSDFSVFNNLEETVKSAISYSENNTTYYWRNSVLKKQIHDFDLDAYNKDLIKKYILIDNI